MALVFLFLLVAVFRMFFYPELRRMAVENVNGPSRSVRDLLTDYKLLLSKKPEFPIVERILLAKMPYLAQWPAQQRYKLIYRTILIRKGKHFHGAEGFVVEDEHEIIISATIARLTLGLSRQYDLPKFELIEIFPREFYSKLLEQHVKGLTLGNGRLFLSWNHFEQGHDNHTDKVHLGLHEFAHAMMIQFDRFHFHPHWEDWQRLAEPIMHSVGLADNHFFRRYGATNIHEFWAVSVETFFEQPAEFKRYYPELFVRTCRMLNQWPGEG